MNLKAILMAVLLVALVAGCVSAPPTAPGGEETITTPEQAANATDDLAAGVGDVSDSLDDITSSL
jgi:hypothetical protein